MAISIIQAMGTHAKLDAIQPMRTSWNIYMLTLLDHTHLIEKGIHLTGKFVLLHSKSQVGAQQLVKVTIKDLPLHSVGNEDVLEEVKKVCKVTSIVCYANLWYNGQATAIQNGDQYLYVEATSLDKMPEVLHVREYAGHIFKPAALSKCRRYGNLGHQ